MVEMFNVNVMFVNRIVSSIAHIPVGLSKTHGDKTWLGHVPYQRNSAYFTASLASVLV